MRGTSLTKHPKGTSYLDTPPAGESALDPEVRAAQQGACQERVKAANAAIKALPLPITKGMQVTARENHIHYTETISKKRKEQRVYGYRVFEGEGIVRTIEDGLCKVEVGGQLRVVRVEQLIPVPCRALVVYEPPKRPAVNVLPSGDPIELFATTETTRYDRAGHSVEGQAKPPHYSEIIRNRALVNNGADCQPVERKSGNGAYFWQFNGTAGYRYAHYATR